ncbi:hypothetical protein EJ08DRAFT_691271 [Tothia fuscella]|uniref:F-box domain-containing protein n=1 Tax=Tothia fuscella TaxID=1048955 RepID=A0A9P4P5M7_9PEZI|nr:hypothetical protein EJ08DRAFT_691271 [Tothia fuscella]
MASLQSSHLLALPRELRNNIYGHLCSEDDPNLRCIYTPGKPSNTTTSKENRAYPHPLLLVNLQLSFEYAEHLFKIGHVVIDLSFLVSKISVRSWTPSPFLLHHVRRVTMKIDFKAFPWRTLEPYVEDVMVLCSKLIASLDNTHTLDLVMEYPHIDTYTDRSNLTHPFWTTITRMFQGGKWNKSSGTTWGLAIPSIEISAMNVATYNTTIKQFTVRQSHTPECHDRYNHPSHTYAFTRNVTGVGCIWSTKYSYLDKWAAVFSAGGIAEWTEIRDDEEKFRDHTMSNKKLEVMNNFLREMLGDQDDNFGH